MRNFFTKLLLIAIALTISLNGFANEYILSNTPITAHAGEQIGSQHVVELLGARGWQYFWKGDYRNSVEMFYLALDMIELQDLHQIVDYYNHVGLLHERLGNDAQSEYYINKALEIAQLNNDISERLRALQNFVALHASQGDMQQFGVTLRDSLPTEQHQGQQTQYETELTELLRFQRANTRNNNILLVIILSLIVTLSVIAVLFYRYKVQEVGVTVRHYEELLKYKKELPQRKNLEKVDASEELAVKLQHLFETEKVYREQGLSAEDVAKMLNTNGKSLSNVVSQYYQKNFAEYVNTFRVEEAIEMLKEQHKGGKYAHYTIQAIGETVGFNGRSSFYAAFKRIVGVAPLEYVEEITNKQKPVLEETE